MIITARLRYEPKLVSLSLNALITGTRVIAMVTVRTLTNQQEAALFTAAKGAHPVHQRPLQKNCEYLWDGGGEAFWSVNKQNRSGQHLQDAAGAAAQ